MGNQGNVSFVHVPAVPLTGLKTGAKNREGNIFQTIGLGMGLTDKKIDIVITFRQRQSRNGTFQTVSILQYRGAAVRPHAVMQIEQRMKKVPDRHAEYHVGKRF